MNTLCKEFIGTLFVSIPDEYLKKYHGADVPETILPIFPYKSWDAKTHIQVIPIKRLRIHNGLSMHVKLMDKESDAVVYGKNYEERDLNVFVDEFATSYGHHFPPEIAGKIYVFALLSAKTVEEYRDLNITFHTAQGEITTSKELYECLVCGLEENIWVESRKSASPGNFRTFLKEKVMGDKYVIRPLTSHLFYKTMENGTLSNILLGNVFDSLKFDSEDDALYFAEAHARSFRASGFEVLRIQNYPYE